MFRRFSVNFAVFSMILDMIIAILALLISDSTRSMFNGIPYVVYYPPGEHIPSPLYVVFPILFVCVLLLFSVYDGRKNLRVVDEFTAITFGTFLATIALAGVLYLSFRQVSRLLFIVFIGSCYLLMIAWRVIYRLLLRRVIGQMQLRQVLILGAGDNGQLIHKQIIERPYMGLNIVGMMDDDIKKVRSDELILGTLNETRKIIVEKKVNDVVIALPRSAYRRLTQIIAELHDLPVRVWVIPDYLSLALHRASVIDFAGIPMLDLRAPALSEYQRITKRIFDITLTIIGLPFFIPAMSFISVAIFLSEKGRGSIFFRQQRVGENGCLFEMIKFRTMVDAFPDNKKSCGSYNKSPHDPRVTRIGYFLRRSSLDELPQIINVIKGEMSLVGPRPELPELVEKYEPWQRKRFTVPQGMTGWWQINGRSDNPMHLHTEEDLYYIQHYSIWLDIQILLKTFWVVLRGKGAY